MSASRQMLLSLAYEIASTGVSFVVPSSAEPVLIGQGFHAGDRSGYVRAIGKAALGLSVRTLLEDAMCLTAQGWSRQ